MFASLSRSRMLSGAVPCNCSDGRNIIPNMVGLAELGVARLLLIEVRHSANQVATHSLGLMQKATQAV